MRASFSLCFVLLISGQLAAEPVPWFESDGGNGHFYELVVPPGGITWPMAEGAADKSEFLGLTGHLVTIGSEAEWDFVTRSFPHNGTWIGLTDGDVEGDFRWVTGEPVSFSAWKPLEPNDAGAGEDYAYYELSRVGWGWNDLGDRRTLYSADMPLGYVIEYPSATLLGDFTKDNVLDAADVDLLTTQTLSGEYDPFFDLTGDGQLDFSDRRAWVEGARNTTFGDSNLDGRFDSEDLVQVFISNEYEDNVAANSTWGEGDWSGDFEFDSGDFVVAFQFGKYERDAAASPIPEPSGLMVLSLGLLLYLISGAARRQT